MGGDPAQHVEVVGREGLRPLAAQRERTDQLTFDQQARDGARSQPGDDRVVGRQGRVGRQVENERLLGPQPLGELHRDLVGGHAGEAQSAVGGQDGGEHALLVDHHQAAPVERHESAQIGQRGVGDVLDPQGRGDLAGDLVQQLGLALALLQLAVDLGVVDGHGGLVGEGPRELPLLGGVVPLGRRFDQDEQTHDLVADYERHRQTRLLVPARHRLAARGVEVGVGDPLFDRLGAGQQRAVARVVAQRHDLTAETLVAVGLGRVERPVDDHVGRRIVLPDHALV